MVKELKRPGRAGGGGFYDYPAGRRRCLWPELKTLFEKPGAAWDMAELKDRLLYRQAIETARCLAEGVLTSVHDANIGSIFGIGFPAWTGGALQFIYSEGAATFERQCGDARQHATGRASRSIRRCVDCIARCALKAGATDGEPGTPAAARGAARGQGGDHFSVRTQATSCFASASLTCGLAGIGTGPQTPEPPLMIFCASLSTASFWPAYLAATSL